MREIHLFCQYSDILRIRHENTLRDIFVSNCLKLDKVMIRGRDNILSNTWQKQKDNQPVLTKTTPTGSVLILAVLTRS